MSAQPLTTHLLSLSTSAHKTATTHPFLQQAGQNTLPPKLLSSWLRQDRLYALSYVSFIGSLLAKISIPSNVQRAQSIEWRVADLLIDALVNIKREIGLFEDILRKDFGWGGDQDDDRPRTQTKAYTDLFAGAGAANQSVLAGVTALWATEKCYLDAWRFARGHIAGDVVRGDTMREVLIPNWSSDEFEEFVTRIGGLLDELAKQESVTQADIVKCEDVWKQVLWAEANFWPEMDTK
ncbi:hypothetical protein MBLNU457_3477t1 [Dothideomycetes sp. NU457]